MKNINNRFSDPQNSVSDQHNETLEKRIEGCNLTPKQRDNLVRSVIGSQAIEGIDISRQDAEEWLDEVLERRRLKMRLD